MVGPLPKVVSLVSLAAAVEEARLDAAQARPAGAAGAAAAGRRLAEELAVMGVLGVGTPGVRDRYTKVVAAIFMG